ncbi:MAG TPA: carbohydrate-binding family 9-like protein [Bryobacteraceae bacterium]
MIPSLLSMLVLAIGPLAPHPKGYVCPRATKPPVIDGRLNDPAWRTAPWTDFFVDIEGESKPKPRFRTRAKMLWDEKYFYIAAELEEPHPWATLTAHDSVIFRDHDFEVFLDPDSDSHNYFEFEINTLNTSWDLFLPKPYKDGGSADNSWDIPGLKTAVHIDGHLNDPKHTSHGWTVEIAFPWDAFAHAGYRASKPRPGDQWRVNFSRVEWLTQTVNGAIEKIPGHKEDNWVWSPQGKINMHLPEHWGYVQFEDSPRIAFKNDPNWDGRMEVQQFYEAQIAFRKRRHRWAVNKVELGLAASPVEYKPNPSGWTASLGPVTIRQDALVTIVQP